jgi:hypothetical protein
MAGIVPAIHEKRHVDPRVKPGDDGVWLFRLTQSRLRLQLGKSVAGALQRGRRLPASAAAHQPFWSR